jgi:hypothetical protein
MGKTKEQKRVERRRRIEHERNVRRNQPPPRYLLYVKMGTTWRPAMKFATLEAVDQHIASVEDIRKRNASDIVEAFVVDTKTQNRIRYVLPHKMTDPAMFRSGPEGVTAPGVL